MIGLAIACEHKLVHVFYHPVLIKWKELRKRGKGLPQKITKITKQILWFPLCSLRSFAAKLSCCVVVLGRFFLGFRNFG